MKLIGNGRLGRDAEVRHTSSGKTVAALSLAFEFGQKGDGGKRQTQWIDASLWGQQAEKLAPYLLKGAVLHVVLRDPHIEVYEGKNGTSHKLSATVAEIEFAPPQPKRDETPKPAAAASIKNSIPDFATLKVDLDDDVPF
jgi:single-strand DNA-binding protein